MIRDAVAQTAFGDLLAEPHQEHRTGQQGNDGRRSGTPDRDRAPGRLRLEASGDAEPGKRQRHP